MHLPMCSLVAGGLRLMRATGFVLVPFALCSWTAAQTTPPAPSTAESPDPNEETVVLSPFEVTSERNVGYQALDTLAGTRLRTDLADVGSAISVVTKELMDDLGGTDSESILAYTLNTEVGGPRGNYAGASVSAERAEEQGNFNNPNANTRVRGLTSADNTRNFFLTSTPWDGYNVSRIDLQRGPNAILFGLGSPAGVVNATTDPANFLGNRGQLAFRYDQFGSTRVSLNYNHVLRANELAVRVALLDDRQNFRQDPAFEDDQRVYGAITYRPGALNSRETYFQVSANYEHGKIESNRPRFTAPTDYITPFFVPKEQGGAGGQTFNHLTHNNNAVIGGQPNPDYNAWRTDVFNRGAWYVYNGAGSQPHFRMGDVRSAGALNANGTVVTGSGADAAIYGRAFRQKILEPFNTYAAGEGLPYANLGAYRSRSLSDPSIFDFYNKLIDGPNKEEFNDWEVFELNLSNTFLNNRLGYDVSYFGEYSTSGQVGLVSFWNRFLLDVNELNVDGTPNPNVGRVYVEEEAFGGNRIAYADRNALRAQLFGEYDFRDREGGWFSRMLGRQRLTAVFQSDKQDRQTRDFIRVLPDASYADIVSPPGTVNGGITGVAWRLSPRYYVSDDVRGRTSASGLDLSNVSDFVIPQAGPHSVYYFDTTWNPPAGVNPGDVWTGPAVNPTGTAYNRQSQNPANYVGWSQGTFNVIEALDGTQESLDYATRAAVLSRFNVDSIVGVYQGYFFNDGLVATYGWREDDSAAISVEAPARPDGGENLSPDVYSYDAGTERRQTTRTENWSVVAHLSKLFGERWNLPVNVSLFYNEGESFQPAAGRLDAFGQELPAPAGSTEDYGITLSTRDNRFSLRLNRYETRLRNASSTATMSSFFAFQQSIWAPVRTASDLLEGRVAYTSYAGDPARLENVIVPAFLDFTQELEARYPDFVNFFTTVGTLNPPSGNYNLSNPAAHRFIEDSVSKGYEVEFIANPTRNWRVAVNAAKTEAIRDNVPGPAFSEVFDFIDNAYRNTVAGEMPLFGVTVLNGVNLRTWAQFRGDMVAARALNGQPQPEIREWRVNVINNYNFTEGRLRGFGVGGAVRYESKAKVGFPYLPGVGGGDPTLDLDSPFHAPSETRADVWVSYRRALTEKIDWRIQLNVYNAFGKNDVIPINTQPDGSHGILRIQEGRSWAVSSSFSF